VLGLPAAAPDAWSSAAISSGASSSVLVHSIRRGPLLRDLRFYFFIGNLYAYPLIHLTHFLLIPKYNST
jgi:hypothetical protein